MTNTNKETIVFRSLACVYDGTTDGSKSVRKNVDIVVRDGLFVGITQPGEVTPGATVLEMPASGLFAVPGLVDCHTHYALNGLEADSLLQMNAPAGALRISKLLAESYCSGLAAIRDMGGLPGYFKDYARAREMLSPQISNAVNLICSTGGHADFGTRDRCASEDSSLFPEIPGRPSSIADGPWECRRRVRQMHRAGADFIKICFGRGLSNPNGGLESKARDFTGEELMALIDEAHGKGLRVAAHAHDAVSLQMAIELGADDIQHGSFLTSELASQLRDSGGTLTPTTLFMDRYCNEESISLSQAEKDERQKIFESLQNSIRLCLEKGIPILAGSDPIRRGMHRLFSLEVQTLQKLGVPPLKAWHGATGLAAAYTGFGSTLGSIRMGLEANLLLFSSDVISNPALLSAEKPVAVWMKGRNVDRFNLRDFFL